MLVELGFFRTELLTERSTKYPEASIEDYAQNTRATVDAWKSINGLQGGEPAKRRRRSGGACGTQGTAGPLRRNRCVASLGAKANAPVSQADADRNVVVLALL